MDQNVFKRNELLAQKVIKGLQSRNMSGYYAESKEQALKLALELIPEGSSVSMGGSLSAAEIGLVDAVKNGNYRFHYNAPVLVVLANQKDYGNNIADCACALENMMIMANALDLGTCWINQLKWLNEDPGVRELFASFGAEENERIYGALAIGYADTEDGLPVRTPLPRKGNPVTRIG